MSLDVEVREPLESAWQVPVALAEQLHRCGHEHRADKRRVDQQRDGDPEPQLTPKETVANALACVSQSSSARVRKTAWIKGFLVTGEAETLRTP
jgi:hypothetical protein